MNVLIIGSGAREHALAKTISRSKKNHQLFCFGSNANPGIITLCASFTAGDISNRNHVVKYAKDINCNLAIIGPEAPLEKGVADALIQSGISAIGPTQKLAQIETSKGFARDLLSKYSIPGLPRYKRFYDIGGLKKYIDSLSYEYVVKADGLMGGKGVKVFGEHLHSWDDTFNYCEWLIKNHSPFVIEEKFIGQEFSLMSFSDGEHLAHMPAVQDYKRAYDGDTGPNTGGMGCISDADHSLPFLEPSDIEEARKINELTASALKKEFGVSYQGILYGGFMAVKGGVKLIEYNARFGDPESIAVLSLLETDFLAVCNAIVNKTLNEQSVTFEKKAAVCKYLVPQGYPDNPVKNQEIDISSLQAKADVYFGGVEQKNGKLFETGSRTVAVLAKADTIEQAGLVAENMLADVRGPLFHRKDIGTKELLQKRIDMMINVRKSV